MKWREPLNMIGLPSWHIWSQRELRACTRKAECCGPESTTCFPRFFMRKVYQETSLLLPDYFEQLFLPKHVTKHETCTLVQSHKFVMKPGLFSCVLHYAYNPLFYQKNIIKSPVQKNYNNTLSSLTSLSLQIHLP